MTIALTPLGAQGATSPLSPLIERLIRASFTAFSGSQSQLLHQYATAAVETRRAVLARVWTYAADQGTLSLAASVGLSKSVATSSRSVIRLSSYRFKVGVVARTGIPYVHNVLDADRDFDIAWVRRERLESAAVFPLYCDAELYGVTAQFFRHHLTTDDVGAAQASTTVLESYLRSIQSA